MNKRAEELADGIDLCITFKIQHAMDEAKKNIEQALIQMRKETIERCAKVCDVMNNDEQPYDHRFCNAANAIRALNDKEK